ncbi:hypothetical protein ACFFTM_10025 [Pseudoduganella plicata]|uniref:Uncharacterized protein n=1 Tax=Pseudoduganella plicata TaxID=321984 RepID=A0AA88CAE0_9BURK|nr:hypothetical protein GCM10007388_07520 [Pseudoduganella plicata]
MLAALLLACTCSVTAAQGQPDAAVAMACRERYAWLLTIQRLTTEERITNMRLFFGQDFEVEQAHGQEVADVYIVRRNPATGHITFRELIGHTQ